MARPLQKDLFIWTLSAAPSSSSRSNPPSAHSRLNPYSCGSDCCCAVSAGGSTSAASLTVSVLRDIKYSLRVRFLRSDPTFVPSIAFAALWGVLSEGEQLRRGCKVAYTLPRSAVNCLVARQCYAGFPVFPSPRQGDFEPVGRRLFLPGAPKTRG
jgi:hypothetical protein